MSGSVNWNDRRVLVTGAGGFIGSHLTESLTRLGAQTRALVEYNSEGRWGWLQHSSLRDEFEVMLGDVRDIDTLGPAMKGVDVVFHLAALVAIPYSYVSPLSYLRTNTEGTLNTLQAARHSDVSLVVHASTSEVYGTAQYVPIDEAHPVCGQSPYSASKIGAEQMAEAFRRSFELPVVVLRPFNTYGPRQSARAVIPAIIRQTLNSSEVSLGELTPTRDFTFVTDTVSGFVKAAERSEAVGETLNLGSGKEISIGALAEAIVGVLGKQVPVVSGDERKRPKDSEVFRLCSDNSKAREVIGWAPTVTLGEGLDETVRWMAENQGAGDAKAYVI